MRPVLGNSEARAVFLGRHGLVETPTGAGKDADLLDVITRLGFVQIDSINTVERAHHMILRARRMGYRPKNLRPLLEKDRSLFEHWTHDASVIPTAFYPHWQLKFRRDADVLLTHYKNWRRSGYEEKCQVVMDQIAAHGPVSSSTVGADETRSSGGWWDWHPSKTALEYLWRSGALTVSRREGFQKVYDLTERVLDQAVTAHVPDQDESIDWLCGAALDRLGFATSGEIAAFWDIVTPAEAKAWCARQTDLIDLDVMGANGKLRRVFARGDVWQTLPAPPPRLRILSPFDPALRDRKRAEWLFGFHYRIEIFVPEAKRKYGYYVFPILEGDRLTGRIDCKAIRAEDRLHVKAVWWEQGVRPAASRLAKLEAELGRLARFAGVSRVTSDVSGICA